MKGRRYERWERGREGEREGKREGGKERGRGITPVLQNYVPTT